MKRRRPRRLPAPKSPSEETAAEEPGSRRGGGRALAAEASPTSFWARQRRTPYPHPPPSPNRRSEELPPPPRARPGGFPEGARLFGEQAAEAARDEGCDVGQHPRQRQAAGAGQVARLPDRVELLLVLVEALKVVEVLAVPEHQGPQAAP